MDAAQRRPVPAARRPYQRRNFYIAFNMATRRSCRPPSKPVSNQIRTIVSARSSGVRRSPMESTLASLCRRERRADSSLQQSAQRTPWTLLATIASPLPEPPNTIPQSPAGGRVNRPYLSAVQFRQFAPDFALAFAKFLRHVDLNFDIEIATLS